MSISDDSLTPATDHGDAWPAHAPTAAGLGVHRFARPAGIRQLQLITVLVAAAISVGLGTSVLLGHEAAVGGLVVVLALTAAMAVSWFGGPSTTVRVEYGVLVVTDGDREHRVDVAGADLEVTSRPGHRGWRAVVRRPGRRALVIDASMVDPGEFTRVLARWRPDLLATDAPEGAPDAP